MRRQLQTALLEVAKRVEREGKFQGADGNKELHNANANALTMFRDPNPVFRSIVPGDPPVNVRGLALWRAHRYIIRRGINWPIIDWETLVQWLFDNWEKILRVLLSLLVLI